MTRIFILAPLALAACNSGPTVSAQNASVEEVAAQTAGKITIQPGKWSTNVEIVDLQMAGAKDPRFAEGMKQAMESGKKGQGVVSCVTKADIEKPNFFGGDEKACRYEHFNMAGGKIDAKMVCASGEGGGAGNRTMAIAGSYSPTTYDMTAESSGEMGGGMGKMTMKMHVTSKRIGECTPAEEKNL